LAAAVAAAAAATAGLVAVFGGTRIAHAGVIMDLRAVGLNGGPLPPSWGAKEIDPDAGDVVTLDLFAVVSGTNGLNDESFQSAHGAVISSGSLLGNLAGGPLAPFNASGSQNGSVQDLDGDTDLDIGVAPNGGTPTTGYFVARSSIMEATTPVGPGTGEIRVARFTWTMTGNSGDVFFNFVRRANASGGNIITAAVWSEDGGIPKNPTLSPYGSGTPVHVIIPEPASVATAAAAVSSLRLLARRGRRARV
jgi:hypothetical protein